MITPGPLLPQRIAALAGGVALATAVVAHAAAPAGPSAGAWATYRWTPRLSQPVTVLVLQPRPGGAPPTWSEERVTPEPLYVTCAIVYADPRAYTLQIVTHEQPDGPPLSVTQIRVDRASGKALRSVIRGLKGPTATPESGLRPLRESAVAQARREEVTVPAGRFDAAQGTVGGVQVWVSDRVPALGLVKGVWPEGTLELVRSAPSGAMDLFETGTR